MTRVTAPITKLARGLTARPSVSVARPLYIAAGPAHHNAASASRPELAERDDNNRHFTMAHRPTPSPTPSPTRVVPLMQTFAFQTSASRSARLDTSTIDYAVMPAMPTPPQDDAVALRMPLLPDNYAPRRDATDGHLPEATDGPAASPQIVVISAAPGTVVPASPLAEIEGMGIDGVDLGFASGLEGGVGAGGAPQSAGMIRDLWKGLVDDLNLSSTSKTT